MPDAMDKPQPALDAKTMMATAAGLWAFFGLTLTTLLKEVVLGERKWVAQDAVEGVLAVILGFFAANFLAIVVSQSISVALIARQAGRAGRWLWVANLLLLACYLFMAWAAYGAAQASFHARPA